MIDLHVSQSWPRVPSKWMEHGRADCHNLVIRFLPLEVISFAPIESQFSIDYSFSYFNIIVKMIVVLICFK